MTAPVRTLRSLSGTVSRDIAPPKPVRSSLETHDAALADVVQGRVDRILDVHFNGPGDQRICTTGLQTLDAMIGGWVPGESCVIAGRTGAGKSAFATHSAIRMAIDAERHSLPPVLFFSLEMTQDNMADRAIAWLTGAPQGVVQLAAWKQVLTDQQAEIIAKAKKFTNRRIRTICTTDASVTTIREHVRRAHKQHGVSAVVCDYIGLIEPEAGARGQTREREVSFASRGMKAMAIELNIPVLILCQLSREARQAQEPHLGLLRESGAIEQDASTVLFLWPSKERTLEQGVALVDVIAGKRRFGTPWARKTVKFKGSIGRFEDYDHTTDPTPGNDWHEPGDMPE